MNYTEIKRVEFERITAEKIYFSAGSMNNRYARVDTSNNALYIAWHGEHIEPVLYTDSNYLYIGVDLRFVIYSDNENKVLINKELETYLLQILSVFDLVVFVTQLTIYIFDRNKLHFVFEEEYPDMINNVNINEFNETLYIETIDGVKYEISLRRTGSGLLL